MKIKKLLLILTLIISVTLSRGQEWTYYKDFPVNVSPQDVVSNNAGTLFMWTSDFRFFYKTINGDWTEMGDGQGSGPLNPVSISVDKGSNRFYVGDQVSGGIYFTSDFGNTWQQKFLTTGPNTGFHEPVIELSNIQNPNLFFGGSFDVTTLEPWIIKYTNQGQTGQIIEYDPNGNPDNTPTELIYTANQKILIGTHAGGIWMGSNNGSTYVQTTYNQHQIYRFTEDSTGRVYALGYNQALDDIFLIYSDDYMNWTPMNLPNDTDRYTTIYFDSFSNYLWLGSETAMYRILTTPTSTTAWADASFNNSEQFLIEIIGDNNGGLYNFSNQTIAQKLNAAGNSWSNMNDGLTGTATKVVFSANNKLFASSYSTNNVSTALNATANWENVNLGGQTMGVNNLYVRPNGIVYANIYLNLKKSVDNGVTYTDITPPNLNNFIIRFYVGETGNLYVVKSNEIDKLYWSQDQGQTWSLLHTFPSYFDFFPDQIEAIAEDSNGVIYVTMNTLETSTGVYKIYYSTDSGLTWNIKEYQNNELGNVGSTIFSKGDKTFAIYGDLMFRFNYANAPNDLTPVNPPAGFTSMGNFMYLDNAGNYYTFSGDLFKSTNEGVSWTNLGKPDAVSSVSVHDILFDSDNRAYIVVTDTELPSQRGIYYVTETLGIDNPESENPVALFPNPAQNVLNIKSSETIIEIVVYDVVGKKVTTTPISANSIDVSQLAQGMYLVKIVNQNNKTFTSKFIKK